MALSVATWWAKWQLVFWLAVAIAVLIALNVWQWKRAIEAPLRAIIDSKDRALDLSEQLLADTTRRASALDAAADAASSQLAGAGSAYRKAVALRPLTELHCAPGQGRVDAVNRALGAPTGDP